MRVRQRLAIVGRRVAACGALALCGTVSPALASEANISANWAGYVALPHGHESFGAVSGTWTQPRVSCTAGRETFSSAWVGLGGFRENSPALEQDGSEADCSAHGRARYSAWWEIIPAPPVTIRMKVKPGDLMSASVTVSRRVVTLRLRDATTHAHFSITRRVSPVDTSSAEWIVEAPSMCFLDICTPLALSDFGSVSFWRGGAMLGSHAAAIASPYWSTLQMEMREGGQGTGAGGAPNASAGAGTSTIDAVPSPLSSPLGAFSVTWEERPVQPNEPKAQVLPGFGALKPPATQTSRVAPAR